MPNALQADFDVDQDRSPFMWRRARVGCQVPGELVRADESLDCLDGEI